MDWKEDAEFLAEVAKAPTWCAMAVIILVLMARSGVE